MLLVGTAPLAELAELEAFLERLLVLVGVIPDLLTLGTFEFDEIILGHTMWDWRNLTGTARICQSMRFVRKYAVLKAFCQSENPPPLLPQTKTLPNGSAFGATDRD